MSNDVQNSGVNEIATPCLPVRTVDSPLYRRSKRRDDPTILLNACAPFVAGRRPSESFCETAFRLRATRCESFGMDVTHRVCSRLGWVWLPCVALLHVGLKPAGVLVGCVTETSSLATAVTGLQDCKRLLEWDPPALHLVITDRELDGVLVLRRAEALGQLGVLPGTAL